MEVNATAKYIRIAPRKLHCSSQTAHCYEPDPR